MSKIAIVYVNEYKSVKRHIAVDRFLELIDMIGGITDVVMSRSYKFLEVLEAELAKRNIKLRLYRFVKPQCMASVASVFTQLFDLTISVNVDAYTKYKLRNMDAWFITTSGEIKNANKSQVD